MSRTGFKTSFVRLALATMRDCSSEKVDGPHSNGSVPTTLSQLTVNTFSSEQHPLLPQNSEGKCLQLEWLVLLNACLGKV